MKKYKFTFIAFMLIFLIGCSVNEPELQYAQKEVTILSTVSFGHLPDGEEVLIRYEGVVESRGGILQRYIVLNTMYGRTVCELKTGEPIPVKFKSYTVRFDYQLSPHDRYYTIFLSIRDIVSY